MNILFVIAQQDFRDEEYEIPRKVLEASGINVVVASKSLSECTGRFGLKVTPDTTLKICIKEICIKGMEQFSAIVFVGGAGAAGYFNDADALQLANSFYSAGKVTAAICIAPVILANAGILKARNATVWPSEAGSLEAKGAKYVKELVVVDGNIITANGPDAALKFGNRIVQMLKNLST